MKVTHSVELDVSWFNTFYPRHQIGGISMDDAFKRAIENGYDYVDWNAWVYPSRSQGRDIDRIIESKLLPK